MRMRIALFIQAGAVLLLSSCGTMNPQPEVVVEEDDTMLHLSGELRPEPLHFPEYLLMPDFELGQHGRIPESNVVGAGLETRLNMETTLRRFKEILASNGWHIPRKEIEDRSFRLLAAKELETLEIRAVQGTGPTHIFILYRP